MLNRIRTPPLPSADHGRSSDQIPAAKQLPVRASGDHRRLVDRVEIADVVTTGELVHVAVRVPDAEKVERSVSASLEHGPEQLDAVDLRRAFHGFSLRRGRHRTGRARAADATSQPILPEASDTDASR